jgi:hypothetical protein
MVMNIKKHGVLKSCIAEPTCSCEAVLEVYISDVKYERDEWRPGDITERFIVTCPECGEIVHPELSEAAKERIRERDKRARVED